MQLKAICRIVYKDNLLYHAFSKPERLMPAAKIIVFCNNIRYNFSEKRTYLLWMIWIRMIEWIFTDKRRNFL